MRRKTTVLMFQATNWQDFTRENPDMANKEKLQERNRISLNSSIKQRHKDELY